MNSLSKQQKGMTFLGWCIVLALIGFFVLLIMRLFPLYNEKFIVQSAMESVASRPGIEKKADSDVFKEFLRTVQVGGSSRFNDKSIKQLGKIEKPEKGEQYKKLAIKFEVRNKFFQDIEFVLNFDKKVELSGKPAGG